jgi:PAS domain-containing protein
MPEASWIEGLPAAVTVIDAAGRIISMNEAACRTFEGHGGAALIGQDVYEVHPEHARATIREMFETQRINAYTIEKEGHWKLIYQCPWYLEGGFAGYVEISLPIPAELPHHKRG